MVCYWNVYQEICCVIWYVLWRFVLYAICFELICLVWIFFVLIYFKAIRFVWALTCETLHKKMRRLKILTWPLTSKKITKFHDFWDVQWFFWILFSDGVWDLTFNYNEPFWRFFLRFLRNKNKYKPVKCQKLWKFYACIKSVFRVFFHLTK